MSQQMRQQTFEDVRAWYGHAVFFKQCLEVFLRALLTGIARLIMKGTAAARELLGGAVIGFGLSHPLLRELFHTAPFSAR